VTRLQGRAVTVARRIKEESRKDRVVLLSGGVAFFSMLALVPTLVAAMSIWGIFADPADAEHLIGDLAAALPDSVEHLLLQQLRDISRRSTAGLSVTAFLTILLALWSASSAMKQLLEAVNAAYTREERRSFVELRGMALLLTLAAVVFMVLTIAVIAVLPTAIEATGLGDAPRAALEWIAWPLIAVGMMIGLGVVYHYAPDEPHRHGRWLSWGALTATFVWLAASALFSVYTSNFGNFDRTYGALGGVVVLMLWLLITALVVVLGAELNSALEEQPSGASAPAIDRGRTGARPGHRGEQCPGRRHPGPPCRG
jgi:membrane protein